MPTRLGVREDAHVGHTRREFDRAAYCQRNSDLPKDQGLPTSARAVAGGVWRSAGRFGAGGLQMGAGSVLSRHYLFADAGAPVGVPDRRSVWVREFDALRAKKKRAGSFYGSSSSFCISSFLGKFGETTQKIVAPVATAFKALLSVAKTNGRLSGRQLHACDIKFLF